MLQAVNDLGTEVRNLQRDTDTLLALLERGLANASGPPHQSTYHGPGPNAPHLVPVGQVTPALSMERRASDPRWDLQGDYTALRGSLSRIRIDPDCRVNDSATGIRQEDQPAYNLLARSARYVETGIKILQQAISGSAPLSP